MHKPSSFPHLQNCFSVITRSLFISRLRSFVMATIYFFFPPRVVVRIVVQSPTPTYQQAGRLAWAVLRNSLLCNLCSLGCQLVRSSPPPPARLYILACYFTAYFSLNSVKFCQALSKKKNLNWEAALVFGQKAILRVISLSGIFWGWINVDTKVCTEDEKLCK